MKIKSFYSSFKYLQSRLQNFADTQKVVMFDWTSVQQKEIKCSRLKSHIIKFGMGTDISPLLNSFFCWGQLKLTKSYNVTSNFMYFCFCFVRYMLYYMTGLNHVSKHIMYPREINLDPVTIVLLIVEYTANVPTVQNTVFLLHPNSTILPMHFWHSVAAPQNQWNYPVQRFDFNVSKYWTKYRFSMC